MVVMALDHARDYFGQTPFDPTDLDKTTPALFFTRWITHFCAPTFVFLAGTSAWLTRAKKSDAELSFFLLKRGVWLVFFEVAINDLAWSFDVTYSFPVLQVIWAIGCSMIFLSFLVRLSPRAVAAIGLAIVLFHNTLDHFDPGDRPPWHTLWAFAHHPDFGLSIGSQRYGVFYPLIPWIGVMALGYVFGSVYRTTRGVARPREERIRLTFRIGLAVTIGFLAIRGLNVYGDPRPWAPRSTLLGTVMSFLDCQKYPPSLSYLAMTLGPAIMLLSLFDRVTSGAGRKVSPIAGIFVVYGRVPFFYYFLHVLLIHAASEVVYSLKVGAITIQRQWGGPQALNVGLPLTYVAWILAVVSLYPACLWFSRVKASPWGRQRAWLSYL
jgi:uncharacterized membrane protein